jgi:DNA-binding transcriptional LysR family regulator
MLTQIGGKAMKIHDPMELAVVNMIDVIKLPNHNIRSTTQHCRVGGVDEDHWRRELPKLENRFGQLIDTENYRLVPTAKGLDVCEAYRRLQRLAVNGKDTTEMLTVECDAVGEELLRRAMPTFLEVFGPVRLRICKLEQTNIKQNLAGRRTHLGIGAICRGDDVNGGMEVLKTKPPFWGVMTPDGHRLQDGHGPVTSADFRPNERIIVHSDAAGLPGLREALKVVESGYRLEVDSLAAIPRFVAEGLALGVTLAWGDEDVSNGLAVRPIVGAEEQRLVFYLPKRAADLTEPARALMDAIRHLAAEASIAPETVETTTIPLGNGSVAEIPLSYPLEETEKTES